MCCSVLTLFETITGHPKFFSIFHIAYYDFLNIVILNSVGPCFVKLMPKDWGQFSLNFKRCIWILNFLILIYNVHHMGKSSLKTHKPVCLFGGDSTWL